MAAVGDFAGDLIGDFMGGVTGADAAASATARGAELDYQYKTQALNYLKEQEQIPSALRDAALTSTGQDAGFTFDEQGNVISDGSSILDRAQRSPLFDAIMGTRQAGEESILRNASATGGLRSGNVQSNLYKFNTQLKKDALLQSYNQEQSRVQGLAGLPSNSNNIANAITQQGQAAAFGITGPAQVQQQGRLAGLNLLIGGAGAAAGFI